MFGNQTAKYFNGVAAPCQVAMCVVCLTVDEDNKDDLEKRQGEDN